MSAMRRTLCVVMVLIMAVGVLGLAEAKNPDVVTWATSWSADTMDPAGTYYAVGLSGAQCMYDSLVIYAEDGSFIPVLATDVPTQANGLISEDGLTYTFPIREGVTFHNGDVMTPEDVEYSIERAMVLDPPGGPVWCILTPLLGVSSTRADDALQVTFDQIDAAVEVDGQNVIFHLSNSYPPFMDVIAGTWCSIVNKDWVIAQGGWSGTAADWEDFNGIKKEESVLYNAVMGTGAFTFVRWEKGVELVMNRNDDYFREPAKYEQAMIRSIPEWSTQKLLFQQGDIDFMAPPRDVLAQVEEMDGISIVNVLTPSVYALVFNQDINTASEYTGSGELDGNGVPVDFFTDINVRKGFNYAFDWDALIDDVWAGNARQLRGPIPEGVRHQNPDQPVYGLDLEKAEAYLRAAWDGALWENGFKMTVPYIEGHGDQLASIEILASNLRSLNPRFIIETQALLHSKYVPEQDRRVFPINVSQMDGDFLDPDNAAVGVFMEGTHGHGLDASISGYTDLVVRGRFEANPETREQIYFLLQQLAYQDAIAIFTVQPTYAIAIRDWLNGWYAHPPQWPMVPYFYPVWKE